MAKVEDGIQSQLRNIEKSYGVPIDELVAAIAASGLTKHTEVVTMLKDRYGMAHAAAHRVSLVARQRIAPSAAGPVAGPSVAMGAVHDRLMRSVEALGGDVEQAPKKGYISLRRRKQFAMLQPGAKWVNIGLVLPGRQSTKRLEPAGKWNALFTHRVRVAATEEVDGQLESWLREAYDAAG